MTLASIANALEDKRSRNTESLTFRIPTDNAEKLRDESQKKGISLNSFVNEILKRYFEWYIYEPEIGFVPILKPVVKEVFTKMSNEQIKKLAANTGKNEFQNAVYFMKGKIDLESFLACFEARMKNSFIQVNHTFDTNSRVHTYVVKHDICENWSIFLKEIIESVFNNILRRDVQIYTSFYML